MIKQYMWYYEDLTSLILHLLDLMDSVNTLLYDLWYQQLNLVIEIYATLN